MSWYSDSSGTAVMWEVGFNDAEFKSAVRHSSSYEMIVELWNAEAVRLIFVDCLAIWDVGLFQIECVKQFPLGEEYAQWSELGMDLSSDERDQMNVYVAFAVDGTARVAVVARSLEISRWDRSQKGTGPYKT